MLAHEAKVVSETIDSEKAPTDTKYGTIPYVGALRMLHMQNYATPAAALERTGTMEIGHRPLGTLSGD
jgi:hypothetical protein